MQNSKTTITAIVGLATFVAAKFGFDIPVEQQVNLVLLIGCLVAFFAKDGSSDQRGITDDTNAGIVERIQIALALGKLAVTGKSKQIEKVEQGARVAKAIQDLFKKKKKEKTKELHLDEETP